MSKDWLNFSFGDHNILVQGAPLHQCELRDVI
jgi:hypothetical protein